MEAWKHNQTDSTEFQSLKYMHVEFRRLLLEVVTSFSLLFRRGCRYQTL